MTTKQDKKTQAAKTKATKTEPKKAPKKTSESIGFVRASEKMHMAVMEIPLTFFEDLGFAPDKIQSAKKMNRKFVAGMYNRLDGMTTSMGNFATAPVRAFNAMVDKLTPAAKDASAKKASAKTAKRVAAQAKPKATAAKARPKPVARRATATAARAKPKARSAAKAAEPIVLQNSASPTKEAAA